MLTEEQKTVIKAVMKRDTDKIIAVSAVAGSGKTTLIRGLVKAFKPKNGIYLAYNKSIVEDSKEKIGHLIDCRTIHSYAYKNINYRGGLKQLRYEDIKENISYWNKTEILKHITKYYNSKYAMLEDYSDANHLDPYMYELVLKYVTRMFNNQSPRTFDYLLKCLHLDLVEGRLNVHHDLAIIDESQDVSGVMLAIFLLIKADVKVIVGDPFQNIYEWNDTVNAFNVLDSNMLDMYHLTKCFRCSEGIARRVELYGKEWLSEDFVFKGNEAIEDKLLETSKGEGLPWTILSRTNSKQFLTALNIALDGTYKFRIGKAIANIVEPARNLLLASEGKPVQKREYKHYEKEYKNYKATFGSRFSPAYFREYLKTAINDPETINAVHLIEELHRQNLSLDEACAIIRSHLDDTSANVLSTAHSYKGLENDVVYLNDDMTTYLNKATSKFLEIRRNNCNSSYRDIRKTMDKSDREMLNLYYVAMSRAKHTLCLDINRFPVSV